jgi:hypothetical protein
MKCEKHKHKCEWCVFDFVALVFWRAMVLACLLKMSGMIGCNRPKSDPRTTEARRHPADHDKLAAVPADMTLVTLCEFCRVRVVGDSQ